MGIIFGDQCARYDPALTLPSEDDILRISGEVCWANAGGRAGLEFVKIPPITLTRLQSWLSNRLEARLPRELVAFVHIC
jgi:hypothetical protein